MTKVILISLTLFGYGLQMQTGDPTLEQTQIVDPSLDPLKSLGIMQSFENKVNLSSKVTRYDRGSIPTESLNLRQESPNHMILDTPEFHAVITPEVRLLATIFKKYGFELRIVGGAVRDLLNGKKPQDLDLATVATPTEMRGMFEKEEIRMVNEKGEEKHYTVTGHINKINFEITSLIEYEMITDGGHSVVQFTKDWKLDAFRRDLTVNAMYLDFQGTLYDYFNGYEDLKAGRVIFIGDPDTRIKNDPRLILRYFKFFGRVAVNPEIHDEQTLKAIRNNRAKLAEIASERTWRELKQILDGNFSIQIMKKMLDLGLAPYMGLKHQDDLDMICFDRLCRNSDKYSFKPITIIASLFKTEDEVLNFRNHVKLPNYERDTALYIVNHKNDELPANIKDRLKHFHSSLIFSKIIDKEECREFIIELLKVQDEEEVLKMFEPWTIPVFPVKVQNLRNRGINEAGLRNYVLTKLHDVWFDNDFLIDKKKLLEMVPQFIPANMKLKIYS